MVTQPKAKRVATSRETVPKRPRGRPKSIVPKETVLRVAAELFDRKGYVETTMQDIAAELRLTKPTLYSLVKGKKQILQGIIELWMVSADAVLKQAEDEADSRQQFRLLVQGWTNIAVSNAEVFKVFLAEESDLPPAFIQKYRRWSRNAYTRIRGIFRRNQEIGVFSKELVPSVATFLIVAFFNLLPRWFDKRGQLSPDAISKLLIATLENGFLTPPFRGK